MENYKFYTNVACEYFPCHEISDDEGFNCLFCFCPLYALGDKCDGNFVYTEDGIKDCSSCTIPHREDGYQHLMSKVNLLIELARR